MVVLGLDDDVDRTVDMICVGLICVGLVVVVVFVLIYDIQIVHVPRYDNMHIACPCMHEHMDIYLVGYCGTLCRIYIEVYSDPQVLCGQFENAELESVFDLAMAEA